jgi:4-alpha-glucanotransferase
MGLHRLYCIPEDLESGQGVYVRYNSEELYAILSLESHRHKVVLVGEDLGTVPSYVRSSMRKHGLYNMYVTHYELASDMKGLPTPRKKSIASLNTHDMPPFAALWQGIDIDERLLLGLLDETKIASERKERADLKQALLRFLRKQGQTELADDDILSIMKACLSFLAESKVGLLLLNIEDLWLETKPQNIPGTSYEYPNWQRKTRYNIEEIFTRSQVIDILRMVNQKRRGVKGQVNKYLHSGL